MNGTNEVRPQDVAGRRFDYRPGMKDYVSALMSDVKAKNPAEPEFHQAVQEVADSLTLVLERHPEYRHNKILERIIEPERVLLFRVPWVDDRGSVQINRGFRIEMNSAIGCLLYTSPSPRDRSVSRMPSSA